jgi:hypothetical protein
MSQLSLKEFRRYSGLSAEVMLNLLESGKLEISVSKDSSGAKQIMIELGHLDPAQLSGQAFEAALLRRLEEASLGADDEEVDALCARLATLVKKHLDDIVREAKIVSQKLGTESEIS